MNKMHKSVVPKIVVLAMLMLAQTLLMANAWAGTEATTDTYYGFNAGHSNSTGTDNTFVGQNAGYSNVDGIENTSLGSGAGHNGVHDSYNTYVGAFSGGSSVGTGNAFFGQDAGYDNVGSYNTYIGSLAGNNTFSGGDGNVAIGRLSGSNISGSHNVFLGYQSGATETGSNKLYIDNCTDGGNCTTPLIYGEFDNHLLKLNGVLNVRDNGVARSQLHFSLGDTDTGGWVTSVLDNNFFVSSGARFETGAWIQRSSDLKSVIAGSGGQGYRIFTHSGTAVGSSFTPILRLHIDYDGQVGINTAPVAGHEIHTGSGAYLTSGGAWTDASSREYKERIEALSDEEALRALDGLNPVKFRYKAEPLEQHVGFIAEEVPDLVARADRKGISPMDIVAVLTKVVREQERDLDEKSRTIALQQAALQSLEARLTSIESRLRP